MLTNPTPSGTGPQGLSKFQMLIWTGQQLDQDSPMYNQAHQINIPCGVDASLFQTAFRRLVDQSQTLRTVIHMRDGLPYPSVLPEPEFSFPLIDFSHHESPAAEADRWCQARSQQTMQLDQLLFDTALLKVADDFYAWYFCQHHIVCDAWSVAELFRRLAELYGRLIQGEDGGLPEFPKAEPPSHVAENATPARERQVSPTVFYGLRPARISSASRRVLVVPAGDVRSRCLSEIASRQEARSFSREMSLFQVTTTLLFSYLFRASGQQEFCVGVPFHNRLTPEARQALGPFIEFYSISLKLDADETFFSLFKKVQVAANSYLRDAVAGKNQLGSNVQFNTILNFIHATFAPLDSTAVQPKWLHPGHHDRQHHLRLHAQDFTGSGQLELSIDFNNDAFEERQQQRAIGHFQRLIDAMGADWHQPIANVNLLSDEEQRRQLVAFNTTAAARTEPSVISSFQDSVIRFADDVAVRSGSSELTYRELGQRVDHVASRIAQHHFEAGRRIAICLERSTEAVVAMLAVLQSGCTFVPLDPAWPGSRLEFVLQHCRAACVLTSRSSQASLPDALLRMNVDDPTASAQSTPIVDVNPDDSAYVLYTSGSTGQPKGVEIAHGGLANYVNWAAEFYVKDRQLSFPLFTPLTFDLTVTSIFVPLVSGGQIVVYPESRTSADVALLDVVEDDLVDIIKLTPSHLGLLAGRHLRHSRVRQLILGGENLKLDLARQVLRAFPEGTLIHNEYGPTEATVGCIVHTLHTNRREQGPSVPIGKPIAGMQAFVLNQQLQPLPDGVPGDLYLAGAGLAKGYLNDAELTAEKFIDHPFDANGRLYKTGDVARFNSDGVLEYLGRQDHQVKIRGARIELGAIESALSQHPEISQVVVTTYSPRQPGEEHLDYCRKCGLPSNYPDVAFDEQMICDQCRAFESYREQAGAYFKRMEDLKAIFQHGQHRTNGDSESSDYDCLALLSGGKDSTYMLARLADMGLNILAFTLDNGYISDEAKANIRRVVEALGVDHQFGSTPVMNEIFVDSLKRHANVCQGCFKTIYTLSMKLAKEKHIPVIVTGLSRGQFFETRLTADLFQDPCHSLVQIDETVLNARKAYHQVDDAVFRLMDVAELQEDAIFQQVQFVDFYRYCDVDLDDMLEYLDRRLPWVRPTDTGRSTNCLINDVGIYVHKRKRGYHNYALPYSWDVRMGHKQREAALEELDDRIDVDNVHRILHEIGYDGDLHEADAGERLAAYYVSAQPIAAEELNQHVRQLLPSYMVPSRYVRLDELPLSDNGKVDLQALPSPLKETRVASSAYVVPQGATESALAQIWSDILRVPKVGTRDNFFDLGGDSILAIQIVARANRAGIHITPAQLFDALTVQRLAAEWRSSQPQASDDEQRVQLLTPIQHWLLEHNLRPTDYWNQSIEVRLPDGFRSVEQAGRIKQALVFLSNAHHALRTQISPVTGEIRPLPPITVDHLPFWSIDLAGREPRLQQLRDEAEAELHTRLTFDSDALLGAILYHGQPGDSRLLMAANHVAVDAVSWHILIEDFKHILASFGQSEEPVLHRPLSLSRWSHLLKTTASHDHTTEQLAYWQSTLRTAQSPLTDLPVTENLVEDRREFVAQLDVDTTQRLRDEIPKTRLRVNELLIAALAKTLSDWSGKYDMRIYLERHGREPIGQKLDFSQTVGWFTSLSPLKLALPAAASLGEILQAVKERIRDVPDQGIGFGLLRYLHPDPAVQDAISTFDAGEVVFNYLGKTELDTELRQPYAVTRRLQLHQTPTIRRRWALEVNVAMEEQLRVGWEYCRHRFESSEISQIGASYLDNVRSMVTYALDDGEQVSASDFPLARLSNDQLKDLASLLNQNKAGDAHGNEA